MRASTRPAEERGAGGQDRSLRRNQLPSCLLRSLMRCRNSIRERVVREWRWLPSPGGSFIVADYALPRNRVASALAYHIVKPYGRDHYGSFVKADVAALTKSAGIELSDHLGLAQVMTGRRGEAVSHNRPQPRSNVDLALHAFPVARTRPGSNTRTLPSPRLLSMRPIRRWKVKRVTLPLARASRGPIE
jgi:hypothetical protein